jgi:hypothetical protein
LAARLTAWAGRGLGPLGAGWGGRPRFWSRSTGGRAGRESVAAVLPAPRGRPLGRRHAPLTPHTRTHPAAPPCPYTAPSKPRTWRTLPA